MRAKNQTRFGWRIIDFLFTLTSAQILLILACLIVLVAGGVFLAERHSGGIRNLEQAVWWLVVTATTTGYGDITPKTSLGKALTIILMALSLVFVSILTATIASRLVERRLLEGKGMKEVKSKGHIIVCGWNWLADSLLSMIFQGFGHHPEVVLVNDLAEEQIGEILYRFRHQNLHFVRGDFTQESVLERSGIRTAWRMIILADGESAHQLERADERALLCALTARSLNPSLRIASQLVNPENRGHLERAGIDPIIPLSFGHELLLSSSALAPGICYAFEEVFSAVPTSRLTQVKLPAHLRGESFKKITQHFRQQNSALVFGITWEEEIGFNLDDILSEEASEIDQFLKRRFEGREEDFFKKTKRYRVLLNPGDDFVVERDCWVLLLK